MQLSLLLPTCGAANPTPPMHLIETKFRSLKHELLKKKLKNPACFERNVARSKNK